jgi:hypothetical protein
MKDRQLLTAAECKLSQSLLQEERYVATLYWIALEKFFDAF